MATIRLDGNLLRWKEPETGLPWPGSKPFLGWVSIYAGKLLRRYTRKLLECMFADDGAILAAEGAERAVVECASALD